MVVNFCNPSYSRGISRGIMSLRSAGIKLRRSYLKKKIKTKEGHSSKYMASKHEDLLQASLLKKKRVGSHYHPRAVVILEREVIMVIPDREYVSPKSQE
jgi:hypothetical protein